MSVSFSTLIQKARPNPVTATSNALREAIAKVPQANLARLANGVRVASEENPTAKFATVGIWVEGGTKFDQRHTQGLSKVLLQSGFYGTNTMDRSQIARTVDELGGQLTVQTGRELSFVAMKVSKENVPRAVGFLSDVFARGRLADGDVANAKKEVEVARQQADELIDDVVFDNAHVCAYDATETGGLGNRIFGTAEGINAVTAEEAKAFRKTYFTGPRTLLVGAGAVSQKELEELAQQHLGDLATADSAPAVETRFVGGDIRQWALKSNLNHFLWAVETPGAMSADNLVLKVVSQIHGSWHRSQMELGNHPIHRTWRNYTAHDFGYSMLGTPFPGQAPETLTPFRAEYSDTGLFGSYIVGRNEQTQYKVARTAAEMFETTIADYGRMACKTIDDRELAQAKVNLKAQLLFNLDGTFNTAKDLASQTFLYGRRVSLEEAYARIDDITAANVQEVLQHYFVNRKPVLSLYGNCGTVFRYNTMQGYFHKVFY